MSYFVYIEAIAIFRAGLMEMLTDDSYEIPTENNKVCIEAARGLVSKLGSPSNDDIVFCEWLITVLDETIKSSLSEDAVVNREHLWTKLYQLQSSVEFVQKWKLYLTSLSIPTLPVFFQLLTRLIFSDLVGKRISNNIVDTSVEADDCTLTTEEENAVRYVGGYIVRALKAKTKDKQILSCLQRLEQSDQSHVEDQVSAQWTVEINRGGLIHITDEAHDCFVSIEAATRRHFKVSKAHTMDESTKKKVVDQITADDDVQFYWCLLGITADIGEEASEEVLESCVRQWVTVR